MTDLYIVITLVAIQRLAELWLAARNTKKLFANGAVETGEGHYPLFIILHSTWLLAILLTSSPATTMNRYFLGGFVLLQLGRVWVIATLGRFWTTRIISVPNAPLIKKGPYRFFAHPNYIIVTAEIAFLPLIFRNWQVAVIWSIANAMLLAWRITIENRILVKKTSL